MSKITYRSDISVVLVKSDANDLDVVRFAQASLKGWNTPEPEKIDGLINYLMKYRHGSPFEHNVFTFGVEAPIFVAREWFRHRIGSFSELSGRYTQMNPEFYVVPADRPLVNTGTSARPEFEAGDPDLVKEVAGRQENVAWWGWLYYQRMLGNGVANEVARMHLPLNIYTQFYWTVNARSLMNFLSLRVRSEDAAFDTRPQMEIQWGAEKVEAIFAELMPITYRAFVQNGRVAP